MRTVDNNGIGALYATFWIAKKDGVPELTQNDVVSAVVLKENNTVGLGLGTLAGRLEHVAEQESCAGMCTVQVKGVVRLKYANYIDALPIIGTPVAACNDGRVVRWTHSCLVCDGIMGRGFVIAVDTENQTCDVLL